MNYMEQLFKGFKDAGLEISDEQKAAISQRVESVLSYEPKIGVMGKTGSGKSSLCNALFGREACRVNDVSACTREAESHLLELLPGRGLKLLDVPGIGESVERDEDYTELYNQIIPDLDLVLWLLKADDRAYAQDLNFYQHVVSHYIAQGTPVLFVLSQADKIQPLREWDCEKHCPGTVQEQNLSQKANVIAMQFGIKAADIIPVASQEQYNLHELVREIIDRLPKEKRHVVYQEIPQEYHDEDTDAVVHRSVLETIMEIVEESGVVVTAVKAVVKVVGAVVGGLLGLFGL